MGQDSFPEDNTPDEIDKVDDTVIEVGMIYPALTYQYNVPMLICTHNPDYVV